MQDSLENRFYEGMQMTASDLSVTGAPSARLAWDAINWQPLEQRVKRLQVRIAKATREGRHGKVKSLQWLLTHSLAAKLLAVKRVTENRGARTAGVDGVTWTTAKQKAQAALAINRRGYRAQPLRRIYIPKRNGKQRPLGIPTMTDRAMQALHLLALEPVSETLADANAYGFRPKRSAADAIEQCFIALSRKHSSRWVLEGDIKACFDKIGHDWLLANIPMDSKILRQWLKSGYMEENVYHRTEEGTPQGGIISPALMVLTLRGLEAAVAKVTGRGSKVHVVSYADDFVITGISREILENKVKPAVIDFLKVRGLELSEEKTLITHIDKGFDFLGFNVRKYNGKLLIKPAKQNLHGMLNHIRETIKTRRAAKTGDLIRELNPKIQGWANYYRHVAAKRAFSYMDHHIAVTLWEWAKRRHRKKRVHWIRQRYYTSRRLDQWVFQGVVPDSQLGSRPVALAKAAHTPIKRHIKIVGAATPYDPSYKDYFSDREARRRNSKVHWRYRVPVF
ncbi:group II intron reverse transcriptase/maturase [Porticoccus sp. GXU_MW_L64]